MNQLNLTKIPGGWRVPLLPNLLLILILVCNTWPFFSRLTDTLFSPASEPHLAGWVIQAFAKWVYYVSLWIEGLIFAMSEMMIVLYEYFFSYFFVSLKTIYLWNVFMCSAVPKICLPVNVRWKSCAVIFDINYFT